MTFKHTSAYPRVLALAVLFSASAILAEETAVQASTHGQNELGIRFSNVTGYGVAYQREVRDNYYFRTTAWFKYYDYIKGDKEPYIKHESDITYNFGLDLQRNIISEKMYRVFGAVGVGYSVREKMKEQKTDTIHDTDEINKQLFSVGIGGGIEYFLTKSISMDLGISYKFDYEMRNEYDPAEMRTVPESTKETALGVSLGLNLNF